MLKYFTKQFFFHEYAKIIHACCSRETGSSPCHGEYQMHYVFTRGLHLAATLPRYAKLGRHTLLAQKRMTHYLVTGINDLTFEEGSHIVKFVPIRSKYSGPIGGAVEGGGVRAGAC
jgi:hypothetical protein